MNFAADCATIAIEDALEQAQAGATLVTASRRLARVLNERANAIQRARGREAWLAPAILPWSAWLGELWNDLLFLEAAEPPPVRLDENQERAVWERAIEGSPDTSELLELGATADAAAEAWELMQAWRLDTAAITAHATEDCEAFLAWAREFESICRREGWLDAARSTDFLALRLESLRLPAHIILAGFDEFTPQQESLLDACRRAGSRISMAQPLPEPAPRAVRAVFDDRGKEIAAAASWARSLFESGATGIAVVFPDLAKIRSQVARTFAQVLDPAFNISAGPALAAYPLVSAALLALELAPEGNDFGLASRLLRSPFLGGAGAEWTSRAALDAELRRFGGTQVSVARIERLAGDQHCSELAALLGRWRSERESVPAGQSPDGWARTFSTLLERLKWPGDRELDSADYQTVGAWRDLLSGFARLGTVLPRMTYAEALARLKRMAEAKQYQPETDPAPVQVLGLLETSGLHFEHLWIAGLDDEHWPGPPKPAPFLPIALQRLRGLPRSSPERELAFAQRATNRLLASAPEIVVSHTAREDDSELAPSPLIRAIPEDQPSLPDYPSYLRVVRDSSLVESIEDHTAPPHQDSTAPGGTRVFQFQAQCPFRAFAELRLAAKPLEAPAPGLSPKERGTLVHHALASVWDALKSHARLCACAENELAVIVRTSVKRAIDWIATHRGDALPEKFAALERKRIERLIHEWLDIEKQRAPFAVLEFESERYAEAGGIRCKVRVDRVDRLDDGRDVIIDYKTGRPATRAWTGDRPDEPQVPLYAISHPAPVAAVLFGQVKVGEASFKGYAAEDGLVPGAVAHDLSADLDEWRAVLGRLGADFRAGVANVDPKDAGACRRCSLLALCRFTESETPASAFDERDANA